MVENTHPYQEGFSDRPALEQLVRALQLLKFALPKWEYRYDVPIGELAPCSRRKFLCDVVAYREGMPVTVFEMDGGHHVTEKQRAWDEQKEKLLARHGIRLWRMWNLELAKIWGCSFADLLCVAPDEMDPEFARLFRRDVKGHMYSRHGELASDWKKLCPKCYGED
jgi:hypothetical protein